MLALGIGGITEREDANIDEQPAVPIFGKPGEAVDVGDLDAGVLMLKDPSLADRLHAPGDELIVEWRALTVALLDELAPLVREQLGLSAEQMPLACVLEGGTWAAGRALAQQLHDGQPPLNIQSDGTVF